MIVFDIRLGVTSLTDAQDGYAARENLAHPLFTALATDRQAQECRALVHACALGAGPSPTSCEDN